MRKLALLAAICGLFFVASFAEAQQADAMVGFGTLLSDGGSCNAATTLCPEKGGFYPNVGFDVIFHKRIGFAFDTTWRGGQGYYGGPNGQPYRPILLDFNGQYSPRLGKKLGLDLFGGIGLQSTRYYAYNSSYSCYALGSCFSSSHHFLVDFGGGLRYYVWNHVFVRPEVRYYNILNNTVDFNSNNVIHVGASIGYTIGPE